MVKPARCISTIIGHVNDGAMLWNPLPVRASSAAITRLRFEIDRSGNSAETVVIGELVAARCRSR